MKKKNVVNGLERLVLKCQDSEIRFDEAQKSVKSPILQTLFRHKQIQRNHFGKELQRLLYSVHDTLSPTHKIESDEEGWLDLESLLSSKSEKDVVRHMEIGERKMLDDYNHFLMETEMPQVIRRSVSEQRNQIAQSLNKMDLLEEAYQN